MKSKALFLDRDGVLNVERGEYTFRVDDTVLVPGIGPALKSARDKGYLLIVVSNQSGVAKGIYSHNDIHLVNQVIRDHLAMQDVYLDAIFYCPHHPDHGQCLCRKPLGLLFEKALARFGLDASSSLMVGDKPRDLEAASSVGIPGLLIEANSPLDQVLENSDL